MAKAFLNHCIPYSTLICIHGKPSLKDRWDLITKEYSMKGAFTQTDLQTHFIESRCPDKGNVCDFLDNLYIKKEVLAAYGINIEVKDCYDPNLAKPLVSYMQFGHTPRPFAILTTLTPCSSLIISFVLFPYS